MGETYWERKQRHLNEDHRFRREQSKRTIGMYKDQERIDRLTADIEAARGQAAAQPVSTEFTRLGVEWMFKKTALLAKIASSPYLADATKARWSGVLQEATVTDRDDASLNDLRFSVMVESVRFDGRPGRSASLTELLGELVTLIEVRAQAREHL